MSASVIPVPAATRFGNLPLLFGKGAPQRAGELLQIARRASRSCGRT